MKNEDVTPIINLVPYITTSTFEPIKSKISKLLEHCYSLKLDEVSKRASIKLDHKNYFKDEAIYLENTFIPLHLKGISQNITKNLIENIDQINLGNYVYEGSPFEMVTVKSVKIPRLD